METGDRGCPDRGDEVNQPTEHLTMAQLLALLLERLPEWPPIKHDERKIRAALHVLMPEPEWRHDCREDIEATLTLIEKNELSRRRPKQDQRATVKLLAALKKAQSAKAELAWLDARQFENVCNLQAGIAFCDREEDEQKQADPRKPRPSSHGSSMPCRRLIIWSSCGWLSDVAFSTPEGSAIKAPGTSFQ